MVNPFKWKVSVPAQIWSKTRHEFIFWVRVLGHNARTMH